MFIALLLGVIFSGCSANPYVHKVPQKQYVVMLSLDGCRYDYPQLADMPNLESIARRGVKLESLQPSFPSKTFPNHYSMATGLYPDHHGIVQNSFYDPQMDAYYKIRDRQAVENGDFYGGEPIWVTAEKQGLRTASFYWVGSEAPVQGIHPTRWKVYDHHFPYAARVDTVIAWLKLPEKERPRLITWYYPEPDGVGHRFGPESPQVQAKVEYLDSLIGDFLGKLAQLPIADQVNVIVTSDHGMSRISGDKAIYFDDYLQPAWLDTDARFLPPRFRNMTLAQINDWFEAGAARVVLGTVGLVVVLLRNALERRGEFALMLATGFGRRYLAGLLVVENAGLLVAGLLCGTVAALAAVAPHLASVESRVNWWALAALLAGIIVVGVVSCAATAATTVRGRLIEALRAE